MFNNGHVIPLSEHRLVPNRHGVRHENVYRMGRVEEAAQAVNVDYLGYVSISRGETFRECRSPS